ncbi:MAG TPA: zinc-ribbon domain-containing protein [Candidatus Anoxymicrobiaceae bacterium]
MAEGDENLTEEQKQLYRKTRVPRKFCPNCGTRNEPDAMVCVNCGKDISWMKIPEPIPYDQAPLTVPKKIPEQQKIFTPRAILVLILILALLAAFVLILVFATKGKSTELGVAPLAFGLVGLMFRGDRSSPSLPPHPCCDTGRNPRARR